jgi:hypothetical protein
MLTALDEYARLAPVLLDPVCTTAPAGSIKCIYHPPTTPRSARLMTGVSAQSCSLRYGPSSEDLCALIYHLCSTALLAVYQCPPVHRQVACFLASTSEESRQRYREVPACVIACVGHVRSTTRRCVTMVRWQHWHVRSSKRYRSPPNSSSSMHI